MKKTMKFFIALVFASLITFTGFYFVKPPQVSAYNGVSGTPTGQVLLSAANTYNFSYFSTDTSQKAPGQFKAHYNMSVKNSKQVMDAPPQITVLTHGLGGRASDWSNIQDPTDVDKAGLFAYDSASLISTLSRNGAIANVYWAKVKNNDFQDFDLYDITRKHGVYQQTGELTQSVNTSKHILIVFQAHYDKDPNDESYLYDSHDRIYYQLNFVLSKIIYEVSQSMYNNGKLPRVNLVGYSRGGITNLMYALDHPDLVANMVSINTPFRGTTTGQINALNGYPFIPDTDGYRDILNSTVYESFRIRWNNNYNALYKNINVLAIGSYFDLDQLFTALYLGEGSLHMDLRVLKGFLGYMLVLDLQTLGYTLAWPVSFIPSLKPYFTLIMQEAKLGLPFKTYFYNDLVVDLDSQHGNMYGSFVGFQNKTKFFDEENSDFDRPATWNMPPVAHSLAPRDYEIIKWVLEVVMPSINECNNLLQNESFTFTTQESYVERITEIVPGVFKNYYVTFDTADKYIIQTFGSESYLQIYDSSEVLIAEINWKGYTLGNTFTVLNATAGTTYRIKMYQSKVSRAIVKLVIIPASISEAKYIDGVTWYRDFYNFTISEGIITNHINIFTITSPVTDIFTFETIDFGADSFLYVVDPRSVLPLVIHVDCDDDSGGNMQAKLTIELEAGVPYLIILTTFDRTNGLTRLLINPHRFGLPVPLEYMTFTPQDAYLERSVTIEAGRSKNCVVSFEVGGPMIFQTFGGKSTVIEVFYVFQQKIDGNGSGYGANAFVYENVRAPTYYRVRITFNDPNETGEIKLVINRAGSKISAYSDISSCVIPSSGSYTLNGVTISQETDRNRFSSAALLRVTPSRTGEYTLETTTGNSGYYGVDFCLLDPRTAEPISHETEFFYDSSGNLQARLTKHLEQDVPYLLVVSTFEAIKAAGHFSISIQGQQEYAITYLDQGGAAFSGTHGSDCPATHAYGMPTPLVNPAKPDYTFGGWYTTSSCTGTAVTSLSATGYTDDITLYAKWTPITYTLTYTLNGGSFGTTPPATFTVEYLPFALPAPERNGYTFAGWYDNAGFAGAAITQVTTIGNKAFYAKWTQVTYTITCNNLSGATNSNPTSYTIETPTITLSAPGSRAGYAFAGWYDNAQFTGTAVTEIPQGSSGDKDLYAKWIASGPPDWLTDYDIYEVEDYLEVPPISDPDVETRYFAVVSPDGGTYMLAAHARWYESFNLYAYNASTSETELIYSFDNVIEIEEEIELEANIYYLFEFNGSYMHFIELTLIDI